MRPKNILVSWTGQASSDAALKAALQIAEQETGHVTGMVACGVPAGAVSLGPWATGDLIAAMQDAEEARMEQIRQAFAEATRQASMVMSGRIHYAEVSDAPDVALMEAARCHDLLVMGRRMGEDAVANVIPRPELVAHDGGRPVLYVPEGYNGGPIGERVVVAWDGGRSAARALGDALSLMAEGAQVTVVTVGDDVDEPDEEFDVCVHLARQGLVVERMMIERGKRSIPECMMDVCGEKTADLLVMGAYQRPKFLEDLFGGATEVVIKETTVPVLFSH